MRPALDELIPLSDIARRLSVPDRCVRRWVRDGAFPPPVILPDGRRRWRGAVVSAWVASLPTDAWPARPSRSVQSSDVEADLSGLASEILAALGVGGWMSGEELCRVIGDHADHTNGTWHRAIKRLRDAGLIESSRTNGYRRA